jgi:hypothetical protein
VILDNGTPVVIPPVYNDVFTAKLSPGRTWNKTALGRRAEAAGGPRSRGWNRRTRPPRPD